MDDFGVYLVMTNPTVGYEECARAAVKAGVRMLQLRMKHSPREDIIAMGSRIREITAGTDTCFIVNDSPSIAAEVGADGVHLGQQDMSIAAARREYPSLKVFGLSTHNFAQAEAAIAQKPDYIGVGPVYATPTKDIPDPTLGPAEAARMIAHVPFPAVAIGGIDWATLDAVLSAGARNFAIVRLVCGSNDPYSVLMRLNERLREARS